MMMRVHTFLLPRGDITAQSRQFSRYSSWIWGYLRFVALICASIWVYKLGIRAWCLNQTLSSFSLLLVQSIILSLIVFLWSYPCLGMENEIVSLWEKFDLSEEEATPIVIKPENLSTPINALVGRLAMRKFVGVIDLEKGLPKIWNLVVPLEIKPLGGGLYVFEFTDKKECERIFNKQPWNFRGSLLLLSKMNGNERPSDFHLTEAPFWIQVHGLQIRAMTKGAAEDLSAILGDILDVKSDYDGAALGECVRVRVMLDVNKPLKRWATVCIEEEMNRVLFRYEKLGDFCYYCGRLNHQDRDCGFIKPNGRKYFGTWLRANGQNPITIEEIVAELERLNTKKPDRPLNNVSPKTSSATSSYLTIPKPRNITPVQLQNQFTTPSNLTKSFSSFALTTDWDTLIVGKFIVLMK